MAIQIKVIIAQKYIHTIPLFMKKEHQCLRRQFSSRLVLLAVRYQDAGDCLAYVFFLRQNLGKYGAAVQCIRCKDQLRRLSSQSVAGCPVRSWLSSQRLTVQSEADCPVRHWLSSQTLAVQSVAGCPVRGWLCEDQLVSPCAAAAAGREGISSVRLYLILAFGNRVTLRVSLAAFLSVC